MIDTSTLFDVREEGMKTDSGKLVKGKKAIVRVDTGEVLGLVSKKYKLVKHQEVINSVNRLTEEFEIEDSQLNLCKSGSVMFVKLITNVSFEPEVGDVVKFGLQIYNSYNGVLPVGVLLIAYRLKCKNGMTAPETMTSFFVKHFAALDLGEIRRKSFDVFSRVATIRDKWLQWRDTKVEPTKAKEFFNLSYGSRLRDRMYFAYESQKEGSSVWDLYQFMMYWSSHVLETRKGNEENIHMLRFNMENAVSERLTKIKW